MFSKTCELVSKFIGKTSASCVQSKIFYTLKNVVVFALFKIHGFIPARIHSLYIHFYTKLMVNSNLFGWSFYTFSTPLITTTT